MAAAAPGRHRRAAVTGHLTELGTFGRHRDDTPVADRGDVEGAPKLLSVAELQTALRLALRQQRPGTGHDTDGEISTTGTGATTPRIAVHRPGRHRIRRGPPGGDTPGPPDHRGAADVPGDDDPIAAEPAAGAVRDEPDPDAAGTGSPPDPAADAVPVMPEWGANPVPVGPSGDRPVPVTPPAPHRAAVPTPGPAGRFRVGDLLHQHGRDLDRAAARALAGSWPGPARVLFGSLTGGAGRSTAAALLSAAA